MSVIGMREFSKLSRHAQSLTRPNRLVNPQCGSMGEKGRVVADLVRHARLARSSFNKAYQHKFTHVLPSNQDLTNSPS